MYKIQKKIALLLSIVLIFTTMPLNVLGSDNVSSENVEKYIEIWTAEDLDNVRYNPSLNYKLMTNIDLTNYVSETNTSDKGWYPIGYENFFTNSPERVEKFFEVTFGRKEEHFTESFEKLKIFFEQMPYGTYYDFEDFMEKNYNSFTQLSEENFNDLVRVLEKNGGDFVSLFDAYDTHFTGVFDGNGYTISGLWSSSSWDIAYKGLFSIVDGGTVRNLNIELDEKGMSGLFEVGGITGVAKNNAKILNCSVSNGEVKTTFGNAAGGIVGVAEDTEIKLCRVNDVAVESKLNYSGAILGQAKSNTLIEFSEVNGGEVKGFSYIGGVVGSLEGKSSIKNTHANVDVSSTSFYAGGLAGTVYTSYIENGFATGNVSASNYGGGLVGSLFDKSTIDESYATGNVTTKSYIAGGLVGESAGSHISNSYARGDVSGTTGTGGLVGYFFGTGLIANQSVKNSYSTGKVTGKLTAEYGAFNGRSGVVYEGTNYYDSTTAGVSRGNGWLGSPRGSKSAFPQGKSTNEMMKQETFKGWDFDNVWTINENGNYPTLRAESEKFDFVTDTDNDGLTDYEEVYIYGTDPTNPDTDEDGLTDYEEIHITKTDPLLRDTDGNGISDANEDFDGDGLTNTQEIYLGTSVFNPDTDNNGILDGDEDFDKDGLSNIGEFILGTDPLIVDTDGDGLTDYEELVITFTDPLKEDTSGNGILDSEEDSDEDGLSNIEEIKFGTDPLVVDTDGDGLTDYEEIHIYKTDPLKQDTDGDKLNDSREVEIGLDPNNPDTNGNGILDGNEIVDIVKVYSEEFDGSNTILGLDIDLKQYQLESFEISQASDEDIYTSKDIPGFIDSAYEFKLTDDIAKEGRISFKYVPKLKEENINELAIYEIDKVNQEMILLENQVIDEGNNTISADIKSLSDKTYILLNKTEYDEEFMLELALGGQASNIDIVFAIDSSGSMGWNDPSGIRKSVTKNFIDTLLGEDRVGVVDFDSYAYILSSLTSDKESAKLAVDKIDSSGGTNISAAVQTSLSLFGVSDTRSLINNEGIYLNYLDEIEFTSGSAVLVEFEEGENGLDLDNNKLTTGSAITIQPRSTVEDNSIVKAIVLLTDGEGSYSHSYTTLAKNNNIKIYTVGLGSSVDTKLLNSISNGTDAKYYHAENADSLIREFEFMKEDILDLTTDRDRDGLSDDQEKYLRLFNGVYLNTDPNNPDTDGDGLLDGEEIEAIYKDDKVHYYRMLSNPTMYDTDGDGIPDGKDPRVFMFNPNDILIKHIEELEKATSEYSTNIYNSTNSNNESKLLILSFIRSFNQGYRSSSWDIVGGKIDYGFIEYVKNNYSDTYEYFKNYEKYYGFKDTGTTEEIDLYHFAATYTGYVYETGVSDTFEWKDFFQLSSYEGMMFEGHLNNLSGWAGDLQTLIKYTKNNLYINGNMYDLILEGIGHPDRTFSMDDLLADTDAYNLNVMMSDSNKTISEVMYEYYDLNGRWKERYTIFSNGWSYSKIKKTAHYYTQQKFLGVKTWPLYNGLNSDITKDEATASSKAFADYIVEKRNLE